MVHSKVMIVDDRLLHIGSANLNNRSMGTDTECDLAIEAKTERERAAIRAVRDRLIGDHCGVAGKEVAAALAAGASLTALPERLGANGHALVAIDDGQPDTAEWAAYLHKLADPEQPIGAEQFAADFLGGAPSRRSLMNILKIAAAGVVVLALVLAWELSPLSELARPERVSAALQDFAQGPWAPLVVVVAFTAGSLLLFPVTILIAATAAAFGPWLGFAYAALGTMSAALLTYAIGRLIGREALSDVLGPRLNRVREKIRRARRDRGRADQAGAARALHHRQFGGRGERHPARGFPARHRARHAARHRRAGGARPADRLHDRPSERRRLCLADARGRRLDRAFARPAGGRLPVRKRTRVNCRHRPLA